MDALLIDTCAAIWLAAGDRVSEAATGALDDAADHDVPLYVSPITAWEIGMLVSKDRLKTLVPPDRWFDQFLKSSGVRLAAMPPRLLIASNFLPGKPPNDPADRIIAATARDLGAILITRDRLLLEYGRQGHVRAISC